MKDSALRRLVLSSLFAALTCVATLVIQIPSPMSGYVNLGDGLVLASGWMLGPVYGTVAAAVGSCLADIISGYAVYAPATFIIKGLVAFLASVVCSALKRVKMNGIISAVCGGITGEIVMVGGYFLYAALIFGEGLAAAASIPGNLTQAVFGIITGIVLTQALDRIIRKR